MDLKQGFQTQGATESPFHQLQSNMKSSFSIHPKPPNAMSQKCSFLMCSHVSWSPPYVCCLAVTPPLLARPNPLAPYSDSESLGAASEALA